MLWTRLQTLQYDKRSRNACTVELVLETITTFSLKYLHLKLWIRIEMRQQKSQYEDRSGVSA